MEHHGGEFPRDLRALTALPGVGPYTARAIVVHAFGAREAAVDTNVRRVLGRVRGGEPTVRELQAFAEALVPGDDPAAWTNAVMDLGATVCRPARAACDDCPIRRWCDSARDGGFAPGRRRRHPPGRIRWSRVRADDALAPRTDHRPRAGCAGRRVGHVRRATRKPSPPGCARDARRAGVRGPARATRNRRHPCAVAPVSALARAPRRRTPVSSRENPAVRAEPQTVGTSGARDPLAREVKLLGSLLGQVIVEQAGPDLLDLVERVRHA